VGNNLVIYIIFRKKISECGCAFPTGKKQGLGEGPIYRYSRLKNCDCYVIYRISPYILKYIRFKVRSGRVMQSTSIGITL